MNFNLAHVHLLLNHFPTVGMIMGLGIFVIGLIGKSIDLKRASLVIFLGIALLTIPTFISGSAAYEMIAKSSPSLTKTVIETHRDRAMLGLLFMEILGVVSWLGLWQFRRYARLSNMNLGAVLILALMTLGAMVGAANIGGGIRHPEFLETSDSASIAAANASGAASTGTALGKFIVGAPWMWPVCETLHFIGLSLLLGVVLIVDLRMMGVMKSMSFATLHRLLPWAVLGFGVNVVTGMLFFIGAPDQYTNNGAFQWKILLVLIAGLNALYFTVLDQPWALAPGDEAPLTAKVFALSAMFLWVGVMFFGSMLPFLGNAF